MDFDSSTGDGDGEVGPNMMRDIQHLFANMIGSQLLGGVTGGGGGGAANQSSTNGLFVFMISLFLFERIDDFYV